MKVVLALLAGAALGVTAIRVRRLALGSGGAETDLSAVGAGASDIGPERVAVDVSAFVD